MPRPRIYANNADRQKAYRQRNSDYLQAETERRRAEWPGRRAYIDGEALANGYQLLQAYIPKAPVLTLHSEETLSTLECLQFLFRLPRLTFGFGLGYDISNWLRDLSRDEYGRLRSEGRLFWREFNLHYIRGKYLRVIDRTRQEGDRERIVYDLYSYFQLPFVAALEAASVAVDPIIREGKRLRGRFVDRDFVQAYNEAELRGMSALHQWLIDCLRSGDLLIRNWTGPGACARYEAKRREVVVRDDYRDQFLAARRDLSIAGTSFESFDSRRSNPWAACVDAFYGGRFELSRQGYVPECWEYDLSSAYPAAMAQGMPCFQCPGEWQPWTSGEPEVGWLVAEAVWQAKAGTPPWGPFPNRLTRNLAWTRDGKGWYHHVEIEAARKNLGHLFDIRLLAGWRWHTECDHDPWSWVADLARERVAIKESNPGRAQALKLVLNSLYGICCDKAGVDRGRVPRYHNPYWAGLITARTRARLLEAAGLGGDNIIYLATDGVHSAAPLSLVTGNGLGDWEAPKRCGIPAVFLAPGTYIYSDGKRGKSRGVPLGSFPGELEKWRRLYRITYPNGGINLKQRHFISLSEAYGRSSEEERYRTLANTWTTRPRRLSYDLAPRRIQNDNGLWTAPPNDDWQLFGELLMVPNDAAMLREEEWAHFQPDWAVHPLDAEL